MAERTPLVAANWKMHKTRAETGAFLDELLPRIEELESIESIEVVICPPYTSLVEAAGRCAGTPVRVAAQNMHDEPAGAFTGEVSAPMLTDLGLWGAVLGHSERRRLFAETDEALARKVPAALDAGLVPILCVGETEAERGDGETEAVLRRQVDADLTRVDGRALGGIVIAYEPVWAIGTGLTATPEQAAEAIALIRGLVSERDAAAGAAVRIVYGGSVKPDNAAELMGLDGIDGALVGGASLDPGDFLRIAIAAAA